MNDKDKKIAALKIAAIDLVEDCLINIDTGKFSKDEMFIILAHGELYKDDFARLLNKYLPEFCPLPNKENIHSFSLTLYIKNKTTQP